MNYEWKLVPVELTGEMLHAGLHQEVIIDVYAAMLAAAPQPPALDGELPVLACASFAKSGNIQCWSLQRDHASLRKLEGEGHTVIELIDRVHVAPLLAEIERLNDNVRWKAVADEQRKIIDTLKAQRDELESGLRIVAVAAKGSTLAGLKMIAKQTLNRAFGKATKCKQCGGSGTRLIYSACGPVQKACECKSAVKDGTLQMEKDGTQTFIAAAKDGE